MAQTVTYDPTDADLVLTTRRPHDTEFNESALFGAAELGKVAVDDDDSTLVIVGLKRVDAIEDSAPAGDRRMFTGFVGTRPYRRSDQVGPVGADPREIEIQLTELNTLLGDHVVRGSGAAGGNRGRETAAVRLAWLLASGFIDCEDRGKVVYPATFMDANDYRGQTGGAVLADIASVTGYDYTLLLDDEGEDVAELFFDDFDRSEVYTTTAKISNAGDDDGTTIFAPLDPGAEAELERNPENVSSGGFGTYAKGSVYLEKASTAEAFRARDAVVSSSQAKTASQAKRLVGEFLDDHDEEEDTVSVAIMVDPADVNKIRRGHRLQARLTFAPGIEDYAWCRVMERRITQPADHDLKYRLGLTLKPQSVSSCDEADEILAAHATVTGEVIVEEGSITWAHATISGWFGLPVDTAVSTIPVHDPENANDGDVASYSLMGGAMLRGEGLVFATWVAELDGTYEVCRLRGTVPTGADSWQSGPPDRIEYWDVDAAAWVTVPGTYTYLTASLPHYWQRDWAPVETTKLRISYGQWSLPGPFGLWGFRVLGVRVYDWLAFGTAV